MSTLGKTAQMLQDLYYQSYRNDEGFFEMEHFKMMIGGMYSTLLINDYTKSKAENQADTGYIFPTFAKDLVVPTAPLPVKTDGDYKYLETGSVISFPYDSQGYGVQKIRCVKNGNCPTFKRTIANMRDSLNIVPFTGIVWWWIENDRTYLYGAGNIPNELVAEVIKEVDLDDDEFYIPSSYQTMIINSVLQMFQQAKQGAVIDTANNSNPNEVLQTVIDGVFKNLKTKAQ